MVKTIAGILLSVVVVLTLGTAALAALPPDASCIASCAAKVCDPTTNLVPSLARGADFPLPVGPGVSSLAQMTHQEALDAIASAQ